MIKETKIYKEKYITEEQLDYFINPYHTRLFYSKCPELTDLQWKDGIRVYDYGFKHRRIWHKAIKISEKDKLAMYLINKIISHFKEHNTITHDVDMDMLKEQLLYLGLIDYIDIFKLLFNGQNLLAFNKKIFVYDYTSKKELQTLKEESKGER